MEKLIPMEKLLIKIINLPEWFSGFVETCPDARLTMPIKGVNTLGN